MRLPSHRKNRHLHRELVALVRVGAGALNEWRTEHPDGPVRLDHAKLAGADLRGANLRDAYLAHADLSRADLSGADLTAATLRGASLRYANLEGVRGLTPVQLAGCDLAGTVLPASVDPAALVESAALGESVGHTRHLFMWMAGMCAFCLLTLASMPCCQILMADGTVKLPIFNASIRAPLFFGAAPLLLIACFHYFHICLQRLWERLADLPAVFPDGQPLDRKTSGWILLSLALRLPRRDRRRRAMGRTQTALNIALAYAMVPATVLAIWWRYALRHEWAPSFLHALAVAWTVHLAIGFYAAATGALRGRKRHVFLWGRYAVSLGVLFGLQRLMDDNFYGENQKLFSVKLSGEDLSARPSHWTGTRLALRRRYEETLPARAQATPSSASPRPADAATPASLKEFAVEFDQTYEQIRGAQLAGADLTGGTITMTHLASAELARARLISAVVLNTDMSRSVLDSAVLLRARLNWVWLAGASLQHANLNDAELTAVIAFNADFHSALLARVTTDPRCDFRGAEFSKATLEDAQLRGVLFTGAKLDEASLERAVLDGAELSEASLAGADLRGASFQGAALRNVNFTGAKFGLPTVTLNSTAAVAATTDLRGADLTGCIGLTKEQLALALVDDATKMPDYLVEKPPKPPTIAATPPPETPSAQELAETSSAPPTEAEPAAAEPAPPAGEDVAEVVNPLRPRR